MQLVKLTALAVPGLLSALALAPDGESRSEKKLVPKEAVVVLSATQGNKVQGTLVLTQQETGVQIRGTLSGLEPGEHGFHIHEYGDLRDPEGKSAGGHFNPKGTKHGSPDDANHHAGDLGNIAADSNGKAKVDKMAKDLKLHFVIGRSIVVHGGKDDFTSQPSGDAGPRVGLGVIGFAEVKETETVERQRP